MPEHPNLAGFTEAQDRLIDEFGQDIDWTVREDPPEYAPGTALDPETGRPYDPRIQPTNYGTIGVTVKGLIAHKLGLPDTTHEEAIGLLRGVELGVFVKAADFPTIEFATEALIHNDMYKVRDIIPMPGFPNPSQYLARLESK